MLLDNVPPTCVPTSPDATSLLFDGLICPIKKTLDSNSAIIRSSFLCCLWIIKGDHSGYGAPSFIVY